MINLFPCKYAGEENEPFFKLRWPFNEVDVSLHSKCRFSFSSAIVPSIQRSCGNREDTKVSLNTCSEFKINKKRIGTDPRVTSGKYKRALRLFVDYESCTFFPALQFTITRQEEERALLD